MALAATVATSLLGAAVVVVAVLTAHAGVNVRLLHRPAADPPSVRTGVCVLIPARNEADHIGACLASVLAQRAVASLAVLVLDDQSTDATADVVRAIAAADPRVRLITGAAPPPGWLGKPYACHQLAANVDPAVSILVFVDADVRLAEHAVAAAVELLGRGRGVDLVSPYPRIEAVGLAERLVQPLLQWFWLTFLPVRLMERSRRPSLAAAGGQFLVLRRAGYERAGGHAAVRDRILDDIELARAVKRSGGRIRLADGSTLATCRMYHGWAQLRAGYVKSAWAAMPPRSGALITLVLLAAWYVVPPLAALGGALAGAWDLAALGAAGYLLAALGRIITGRATGARVWPDALAHPVSVVLLGYLVLASRRARANGRLTWKGRPLTPERRDRL